MLHEEGVHFSGGGGILPLNKKYPLLLKSIPTLSKKYPLLLKSIPPLNKRYLLLRGGILFRRRGYISGMIEVLSRGYTLFEWRGYSLR